MPPPSTNAINSIRALCADVVQKSNSGHPGAPMGLAAVAGVLWAKMKFSPKNSEWYTRDRFVLSNGHACVLQYVMLHLCGYDVTMDDLKQFRQLNSRTPGHPENYMTDGIEVTTGPLGQGFANAVGLAIAEENIRATFNRDDLKPFGNFTYTICGDGCLQEGISSEAASLAGHLKLGRLIVIYDDNQITIDGDTAVSFTEDVVARFKSYGWHTQVVQDGNADYKAIEDAITTAQQVQDRPSFIKVTTIIGFGSKNQGKEKVHGAALGDEDVAFVKQKFGLDPAQKFHVADDVRKYFTELGEKGDQEYTKWRNEYEKYESKYPSEAKELHRRIGKELPENLEKLLPSYKVGDAEVATRKLSENVLNAIADAAPELMGGSADLTASNLTRWKTAIDYQPSGELGNPKGRYIRFGVREHAMAAITNGMAAYGGFLPFGATFLNFIGYAQGAFRLSCLSHLRVLYIMTHDSIGLGEDGPTHQPIEVLPLLRATPNCLVLRPADGNEVSGAYMAAFKYTSRPSVMCLSRQNLPQLDGSSVANTLKGAYILNQSDSQPEIILVGTGSEVAICVAASLELRKSGRKVSVVSMPSWELFEMQDLSYRKSVFPAGVPVLSVEAQSTFGWSRYAHGSVGMTSFGTSGPYKQVYDKFGLSTGNVVEKAQLLVGHYTKEGRGVPDLLDLPW